MKTRVITAIVALAVFVGVLLAPPIVFTIALAAVTVIMLLECYKATKADAAMKVVGLVSAAILAISLVPAFTPKGLKIVDDILVIAMILIIIINMILIVFKHGKKDYKEVLSNAFLTLYIVFAMYCILSVRAYRETENMLLIFITAWSCDTFAYFSGRFFGKHKLIPHVSPNKTVEGAIGGVIGAIISCFLYDCIVSMVVHGESIKIMVEFLSSSVIHAVIIGGICGICSQLGDLIASAIKRDAGIKDFGWIFPGHGGFMDRFDSVIFIAPIILLLSITI